MLCLFLSLIVNVIYFLFAGLVASTYFQPPHYRLMDRMFADICQEELDFMVDFGLIDTDGQVSHSSYA